ncbi:hypothetical protein [Myroides injenensis]|uniref:hypothetical protein n=1 Tax=Myroides injenensis TaxID=1183151 RepID=UPI00226DE097|nr:hypothetical protein [Myroides injenensis]
MKKSVAVVLTLVILYSFYNFYFVEEEVSILDYQFYLRDITFYVYFLISVFLDLILVYSLFRNRKESTII